MMRLHMITLAGISMVGNLSLAHAGPMSIRSLDSAQRTNAGGSVVTVAVQVGREVAGTVAALPAVRRSIALSVFDVPEWTVAGRQYRARFLVRNQGDVSATLVFTLATRDSVTRVEPSTITLAPGASAVVTVVTTSVRNQGVAAIGLRATDRDAPDVHATASAQTVILRDRP